MPYRRLPNTDLSRIASLEMATKMEGFRDRGELVLSYRTIQDALQFLNKFKKTQSRYTQYNQQYNRANKAFRQELAMARMYVSHFAQVLCFAVQRGELKKEILTAYGISAEGNIPDLSTEPAIVAAGGKIIKAEEDRTRGGGVPIYNPTIAKVKVHWNIFQEHLLDHEQMRANVAKSLEEVTLMRPQADALILDIWNQVERFYGDLPQNEKMEKCKKFGVIYYFRTGEKNRMKAAAQQNRIEF